MRKIKKFVDENGWFLFTVRLLGAGKRRLRDGMLARQLHTSDLKIGRSPRLSGLAHMRIGRSFSAGDGLWMDAITAFGEHSYAPVLSIGDNVNFSDHVHVACTSEVTIGSGVLVGSNVLISDHSHGSYDGVDQSEPGSAPALRALSKDKPVRIGRNVWMGDGVAVLAGADIGDGAIIGAHSVVTGLIPAGSIAAGAPARLLRRWNAVSRQWEKLT